MKQKFYVKYYHVDNHWRLWYGQAPTRMCVMESVYPNEVFGFLRACLDPLDPKGLKLWIEMLDARLENQ